MNARLPLTTLFTLILCLGCPSSPEDEDVNEIPPKENNDSTDAGNEGSTNIVTDAGHDGVTPVVPDAGVDETINTTTDAGHHEQVQNNIDAGNNTIIEITDAGTIDICMLPSDPGNCLAAFQNYYFNSETGQCETFIYGGCGGNDNNFESLEDCEAACGANATPDAGNAIVTDETDAGPTAAANWDFVSFGGCGDVYIHGRNLDDTVGIEFTDGLNLNLAEMAHNTGSDTSTTVFDLAVSPDTLTVTEGTHVTYLSCNDALDPSINVTTSRTWKPISGTATITLTPNGEPTSWGGYPAAAVLVLENVVMSPTDDNTVTMSLENLTITTFVGWLPG